MNLKRVLLIGVVFALLAPLAKAQAPTPERLETTVQDVEGSLHDHWFGIYEKNKKIGYMNIARHKVTEDGQSYYRERLVTHINLVIAGKKLEIKTAQRVDFDAAPPFKMVRAEQQSSDGKVEQIIRLTAVGKGYEAHSVTGNIKEKRILKGIEYTLADSMAQELWLMRGPAKGATFTSRTFAFDDLKTHTNKAKLLDAREVLDSGGKRTVRKIEIYDRHSKLIGTCECDDKSHPLTVISADGDKMRRESESEAKAIEFSADLYEQCTPKLDGPVGDWRTVKGLVLEVKGKEMALLPQGPGQSVVAKGADVYVIKIGKHHGTKIKAAEKEIREALEETAEYPFGDAKVLALAKKAIGDATTDGDKVQRLCKFVHEFIRPTWDEAGGAAKVYDIMERKCGVCRHYAVLFTCLARAVGVPSRELSGLVYMGLAVESGEAREYAPHQWNEVLLDGCWVPVDATLNWTEVGVTHICLCAKDQPGVSFQMMGKQTLKVIDVERE